MDSSIYDELYRRKDRSDVLELLNGRFYKGMTCYEIGAGTGLLAHEIADKFLNYVAVEPDIKFFKKLQERSDRSFLAVNGYIDEEIGDEFDLGLCIFNVVNHITPETLFDFIASCAQKLNSRGDFVFDAYNSTMVYKKPPCKYEKQTKYGTVSVEPSLTEASLALEYFLGGQTISKMKLFMHDQTELEQSIRKCFSSYEKQYLNGIFGDPYFVRYTCAK